MFWQGISLKLIVRSGRGLKLSLRIDILEWGGGGFVS